MRLALTFNRRRSAREEEAEYDTLETVYALTEMLVGLGHVVMPIEVSCSIPALVARLRRASPDLVFNLAEGSAGRFREAFYPALFEQLSLRHTGSNASVLALCLDKALSKRVVAAAGVPVPGDAGARMIVKPRFEGSSKGITQASVVDACAVDDAARDLLARYPEGVMAEEYVDGVDVSVGFVHGIGLMPPIRYAYVPTGAHRIMDLSLKQRSGEAIRAEIPAKLDERVSAKLADAASRAFHVLDITGYGRADFRVTDDGEVLFLEMNPLPSLATTDDELFVAAAHSGAERADVLAGIVCAAA
jgi:D-alanine-D-alanine ligase